MTPSPEDMRALTASLHAQIALTAYLQIAIVELDDARCVVAAPLAPARNHRATAFGPSVLAAAGLAPWLLLVRRAWAARVPAQILLRRCEFAIHRPIASDYRAICDDAPMLDVEAARRGDKHRLTASARVVVGGTPSATYHAHFTIVPGGGGDGDGDLALPFPAAWRS